MEIIHVISMLVMKESRLGHVELITSTCTLEVPLLIWGVWSIGTKNCKITRQNSA